MELNQGYSQPVLKESIALVKEAIAIEPDYAPFYTLLANLYDAELFNNFVSFQEIVGPVKETVDQIVRIDPESADAFAARSLMYWIDHRWRDCLEAKAKAVELAPGDNLLRMNYCGLLGILGFLDKAMEEYRRILENDPQYFRNDFELISIHYSARRYDTALSLLQKHLDAHPEDIMALWNISCVYSLKGMHREALEAYSKQIGYMKAEGTPIPLNVKLNEPIFLANAGERDKALALLTEIEKLPERINMGTNFDFWKAALLGLTRDPRDRDEAFRCLERSTTELHAASATYGTEPFLDPLRLRSAFRADRQEGRLSDRVSCPAVRTGN